MIDHRPLLRIRECRIFCYGKQSEIKAKRGTWCLCSMYQDMEDTNPGRILELNNVWAVRRGNLSLEDFHNRKTKQNWLGSTIETHWTVVWWYFILFMAFVKFFVSLQLRFFRFAFSFRWNVEFFDNEYQRWISKILYTF